MKTILGTSALVAVIATLGVTMFVQPAEAMGPIAFCINSCNLSYEFCTQANSLELSACYQGCSGVAAELCRARCDIQWEFGLMNCENSRNFCYLICDSTIRV